MRLTLTVCRETTPRCIDHVSLAKWQSLSTAKASGAVGAVQHSTAPDVSVSRSGQPSSLRRSLVGVSARKRVRAHGPLMKASLTSEQDGTTASAISSRTATVWRRGASAAPKTADAIAGRLTSAMHRILFRNGLNRPAFVKQPDWPGHPPLQTRQLPGGAVIKR